MSFDNIYSHLYSDTILSFIKTLKDLSRKILKEESFVEVKRSRFYVSQRSYPLNIVVFEHPKCLGYFNSEFYELGIHKAMMFVKDQNLLKNLIRHELAHYLTFIRFGEVSAHGKEFLSICKELNWGVEVSSAMIEISNKDLLSSNHFSNKILSKVKKLFLLAEGSTSFEAEAATLKANELLLKYNLEANFSDEEMSMRRILRFKKASSKLHAICDILRTFLVCPVINYSKDFVYLEIFGKVSNVEVAEYVACFLEEKLEILWCLTKKKHPHLKGLAAKNSFFRGLAIGYKKKIEEQKKKSYSDTSLMKIEKMLELKMRMAYPRLVSIASKYKDCKKASALGEKEGKGLTINQGLSKDLPIRYLS